MLAAHKTGRIQHPVIRRHLVSRVAALRYKGIGMFYFSVFVVNNSLDIIKCHFMPEHPEGFHEQRCSLSILLLYLSWPASPDIQR